MLCLSRNDLEAISQRVLRAYWKIPEANETPWYVDPDLLLSSLLGLKIQYRHLSDDGLTLGMTSFGKVEIELPNSAGVELLLLDGKTVLIEQDLQDNPNSFGRRNFTLSHEGSHHILNMLFPDEYSGGNKARKVMKYRLTDKKAPCNWEEWQMDVLASCILMPTSLIKYDMRVVGLPDKLDYLNPKWRRQDYAKFVSLSDLMGVSKEALAYRMQRLGLIGEDQRQNPNDLLDILRY